jgi:uncharacterized glyoxalase superfamily protein PhnB
MGQTVTPYLLYEDADAAIDFLLRAFGFRELTRTAGSAGGVHAELEVAPSGGQVYLGSPGPGFEGPAQVGRTSLVYVLVENVNPLYERARAAGAVIVEEPVDLPFGHRRFTCDDPQGHQWAFAMPIARE